MIERQRRQPAPLDAILNDSAAALLNLTDESAPLEIEIVDDRTGLDAYLQYEDDMEGPNPDAPATLSDLTERIRITTANASPAESIRSRPGHGSLHGSQHLEIPNAAGYPKRQYLSELSALELFIVKHLAVLTLAPIVSEYFTLEELLDLIGQRKQTLWGRFVKGLKTDKKKPKGKRRVSAQVLSALPRKDPSYINELTFNYQFGCTTQSKEHLESHWRSW